MGLFREMTWLDAIELTGLLCLPVFMALDLVWRNKRFQTTKFWRAKAALVTWANFHVTAWVAVTMAGLFAGKSLFNGSVLGTVGGAVAGVLVYELAHYWYHRTIHRSDFLFQKLHQMHHAAESIDAFSASYIHPLDNAIFTALGTVVFFPVMGLSAEAGLVASTFLTFNAVFQHANIRTPRWLGYLIQRPESHRVHHARGIHRHNYSDVPLWDMVFGTFRNPGADAPELERDGGYYLGASDRIIEMLVGEDVTSPRLEPAPARVASVRRPELVAR